MLVLIERAYRICIRLFFAPQRLNGHHHGVTGVMTAGGQRRHCALSSATALKLLHDERAGDVHKSLFEFPLSLIQFSEGNAERDEALQCRC